MSHRFSFTLPMLFAFAGCFEFPAYGGGTTGHDETGFEAPSDDFEPADAANVLAAAQIRQDLLDAGIQPVGAAPAISDPLFDLGQALTFDKTLSGNLEISCSTCHHPTLGTDDDRSLPAGEGALGLGSTRSNVPIVPRSAPPLFNLHTARTLMWDGRIQEGRNGTFITPAGDELTHEMQEVFAFGIVSAQAMFPVLNRTEMRGQPGDNELADIADDNPQAVWAALMARLALVPEYPAMFEAAYPGTAFNDMNFAHAANAIAGFEVGAFHSRDSRFERFMRGENTLTQDELDGASAFLASGCARCHNGEGLSDQIPHNTGLAQIGPGQGDGTNGLEDFGGGAVDTGVRYSFRTPPLPNVAMTGPWGHAGQFSALDDFVDHYNNPADSLNRYAPADHIANPTLWPLHFNGSDAQILATLDPQTTAQRGRPGGGLAAGAIVDFLNTLTSQDARDLGWTVPSSVPSGLIVD
jgi:cytochrome c peroxidase